MISASEARQMTQEHLSKQLTKVQEEILDDMIHEFSRQIEEEASKGLYYADVVYYVEKYTDSVIEELSSDYCEIAAMDLNSKQRQGFCEKAEKILRENGYRFREFVMISEMKDCFKLDSIDRYKFYTTLYW